MTKNKSVRWQNFFFGFLGLFLGIFSPLSLINLDSVPSALADALPAATPAPSARMAQSQQTKSTFFEHLTMTDFSYYYGPSLGNMTVNTPKVDGSDDPKSPQALDSTLFLGYKLSDTLTVGLAEEFFYKPFVSEVNFTDPFIKLAKKDLIKEGHFSIAADLRGYIPLTQKSIDSELIAGIRSTQFTTYEIPDTKWSIGSYSFLRFNAYTADGTGNDLIAYFGPHIDYQITPTISASLLYEMATHHKYNTSLTSFEEEAPDDIEPSLSWDITPSFTIAPYLNLFPSNLSIASTTINMIFVAKLF